MSKQKTLAKLDFNDRLKYAPYSIWIDNPQPNNEMFGGSSVSSGTETHNGITYFIERQHNCNGYNETVNIFDDSFFIIDGKDVLKKAIEKWGVVPQIEMLNEEATELALAARKWLRKGTEKEFENLAEEIADVEILIDQMAIIYPNIRERIAQYRHMKMQRLERRVNGNDFEGK